MMMAQMMLVPMNQDMTSMAAFQPTAGSQSIMEIQTMMVQVVPVPVRSEAGESPEKNNLPAAIQNRCRKTRMCTLFPQGRCHRGASCFFAHWEEELQKAPDLAKTRLCVRYFRGACTDADCKFAHGYQELRGMDGVYKTGLCHGWQAGNCRFGSSCRFAHGTQELRQDMAPPQACIVEAPRRERRSLSFAATATLSSKRWSEIESDEEWAEGFGEMDTISSTTEGSGDDFASTPSSCSRTAASSAVSGEADTSAPTTLKLTGFSKNFTRAQFVNVLNSEGFATEYDFLYLPSDFRRQHECFGYGFVNFCQSAVAERAKLHFENSQRRFEVTWSNSQGLAAQLQRFRSSSVMHSTVPEELKPAHFHQGVQVPFPDGDKLAAAPSGRRAPKFSRIAAKGAEAASPCSELL